MNREIKCPNCGTTIQIDESTYDSIVKQIHDEEFSNELKKQNEAAINLVKVKAESELKDRISEKEKEINALEKTIDELKFKAKNDLELLKKELDAKEDKFQSQIDKIKADNDLKLAKKDNELDSLQAKLEGKDKEKELELSKAASKSNEEINNLKMQIKTLNETFKQQEASLKSNYEFQLKAKQDEVDAYKDFKAKQSTKAIGEDLEHYCENQFNRVLRPMMPNCYFEKDNKASKESGSKGDFIFVDYDDDKVEVVSAMIECKNEADTTEKKHKNEDFFKELDKDRKEKNCEYAILCSTLEADNDLYNDGIVDVSYRYEKMFVVRPQQLIPLLTLLRNSSLKVLNVKKELIVAQNQNLDIAHFEENMNTFKNAFSKNYEVASKKFKTAIEEIDKTIDHLQKTKDALLSSENNLRLANNKAQDLSIKKLTKNAPSVAKKFEQLD